jgi:hypothetical protein
MSDRDNARANQLGSRFQPHSFLPQGAQLHEELLPCPFLLRGVLRANCAR